MSQNWSANDNQSVGSSALEWRLGGPGAKQATASVGGLVSRTPIPDRLVHRPEELKRNAQRFDQLCRLAEEVAYPIVGEALVRETAAIGAEALANEAKLALEGLVVDSALKDLDEPGVLDEVRKSLERAVPPPSDEECLAMTRDVAQVLMSTWLEMLRHDLSSASHLVLSDQLLPLGLSSAVKQFVLRLVSQASQPLRDEGLGALSLNESEADRIMKTLRFKLFSEPRLVELPFELVVVGAPKRPVLAMTQATYQNLMEKIERMSERRQKSAVKTVSTTAEYEMQTFVTPAAQVAAVNLSAHLSENHYALLSQQAGITGTYLYRVARRG